MSHSVLWRLALLVLAAAGILAALFLLPVRDWLPRFLCWARGLGVWGACLFVLVYLVAAVLCVPGSVLTLGAGFAFGLGPGVVAASLGSTLGAASAFLVSRYLARGLMEEKLAGSPRFRALDQAVAAHGFRIVLLTRLSPVLPYNLLNYAFGLTAISFRSYLLASWLGMLPGALLYTYLGSFASSLAQLWTGEVQRGPWYYVLLSAGLLATAVVTIYLTRLARQTLRRAAPNTSDENKRAPV
jgi:uncharacterized membrane protein YdjX (TVP38/TMEM64 family)